MEEPCQEMGDPAFELFDRFGRPKEFKAHPERKGSGIWNSELDGGVCRKLGLGALEKACANSKHFLAVG